MLFAIAQQFQLYSGENFVHSQLVNIIWLEMVSNLNGKISNLAIIRYITCDSFPFFEVLCVNFDERCQTARINSEYNIQEIPSEQQKKPELKLSFRGDT